jgi:hypothetical protein
MEMPVIPANRVVDPKRIIRQRRGEAQGVAQPNDAGGKQCVTCPRRVTGQSRQRKLRSPACRFMCMMYELLFRSRAWQMSHWKRIQFFFSKNIFSRQCHFLKTNNEMHIVQSYAAAAAMKFSFKTDTLAEFEPGSRVSEAYAMSSGYR